jgi:hypothetical protein
MSQFDFYQPTGKRSQPAVMYAILDNLEIWNPEINLKGGLRENDRPEL